MNKKLLAIAGLSLVLVVSACDDDNDSDIDTPSVPTGVVTPDTLMPVDTLVTDSTIAG